MHLGDGTPALESQRGPMFRPAHASACDAQERPFASLSSSISGRWTGRGLCRPGRPCTWPSSVLSRGMALCQHSLGHPADHLLPQPQHRHHQNLVTSRLSHHWLVTLRSTSPSTPLSSSTQRSSQIFQQLSYPHSKRFPMAPLISSL